MLATKFTLFMWSMSQDLSFLWWKNNDSLLTKKIIWDEQMPRYTRYLPVHVLFFFFHWTYEYMYQMYTVLYGWLFFLLNSQLHVDSILHLSWLFQVKRLGWVWADTPLDRWARTCPRSTLSWWPRTTCSRKPWLQTKGQSYTPCYSIWGSFISVNMLTMK